MATLIDESGATLLTESGLELITETTTGTTSMASLVYDSFYGDLVRGNINPETDTFYIMLVISAYTADKGAHSKRSNVTSEASGTNYTAGGKAITVTASTLDTTNHLQTMTFAASTWATSTVTARGAVVYKRRGGASTADELCIYIDFGQDVVSSASTFTVAASTLTFGNT